MSHISKQVAAVEGGAHEPGGQVQATSRLGAVPWPEAGPPVHVLAPSPEINTPASVAVRAWTSLPGVRGPRQWE